MGDFLELRENALAFILTGAITAGVLQVTQLDVAYGLLYEVWFKSLKQTLLTPVGVTESLFGAWLNGILRGGVIFAALGISAMALFGFAFPPLGPTLIFLSGIFGCALLLGLLVNVLLLTFGQKAEITAWMLVDPHHLFSGISAAIFRVHIRFYPCSSQRHGAHRALSRVGTAFDAFRVSPGEEEGDYFAIVGISGTRVIETGCELACLPVPFPLVDNPSGLILGLSRQNPRRDRAGAGTRNP